jgi:hypothetical protein
MFGGHETPFSFASSELLAEFLRAEIDTLTALLANNPDLRIFLDDPEASVPQRTACFVLLSHHQLVGTIDDTLTARYEQPSLNNEQLQTVKRMHDFLADDAPAWTLEMQRVIAALPNYIYKSLPQPLRVGGWNRDNAEQMGAIESAKATLSNVAQIQSLTKQVMDQQLKRLESRWSVSVATFSAHESSRAKANRPKGYEGLPHKEIDLSRYMDNLTEKQQMAFSLKNEYRLGLAEIASRMNLDRKTVYEHIDAANRKIDQGQSREKRETNQAKTSLEE